MCCSFYSLCQEGTIPSYPGADWGTRGVKWIGSIGEENNVRKGCQGRIILELDSGAEAEIRKML